MRFACMVTFLLLAPLASADEPKGVLPKGSNGRPLNLDFEKGNLTDWLVEGKAFVGQPIKGDTVYPRRRDSRSRHQGKYWIGGYEKLQDAPTGTLTSAPFKVTHPFAAFLVGGGPHQTQTCVELVRQDTNEVFFRTPGREREDMERMLVDLRKHEGKTIFIRLVDKHTGHWGHINFDDFRFYKTKPKLAKRLQPRRVVDVLKYKKGLTAEKAADVMTVPKGFRVSVVAKEPDVCQPIAMTIDDRGRLWVAEAYSYPQRRPEKEAKDRILIFEDTNGDGQFDKRTVFHDKLNLVSGLEVGFGGVWVGAAPYLLFIPDKNHDDHPDGPPQVLLDGWGYQDTHETLNSFIWGPDGWLYGCHGVFTHSNVGKPGAPRNQRVPINAGIWRYHPTKHKFEVFAHGTSNPWGVDFNEHGHCFLTCCVIPHLFHIQQGGRYRRQAGSHFNPYTYADIKTIAKHRHWVGNQWSDLDRAKSDASGGGHAHAGAMFYLGGAWPKKYHGRLFMNNIHGARLNVDRVWRQGSGYVGDGEPDFCKTNDVWSQILYFRYGPDGQVYMIDWYDRQQCHRRELEQHDRSNGRIFKIGYQGANPVQVDLREKTDMDLAKLQFHENEWYVRHARRLLQERSAIRKLDEKAVGFLTLKVFHSEVPLRALWALHVTGNLQGVHLEKVLDQTSEEVRSWAIQLACEEGTPSAKILQKFETMASQDESQLVRLYLASAIPRLPVKNRWPILEKLVQHSEDANDNNLPLMYWYAAEPLANENTAEALRLATASKVPLLQQFMARRVASMGTPESRKLLIAGVLATKDTKRQLTILREIQNGLRGQRKVTMPKNWSKIFDSLGDSEDGGVRAVVWSLAVKFGDPTVQQRMRTLVSKSTTPLEQRKEFLETLLSSRDAKLLPILQKLLADESMRADALKGLASFDDPETPSLILKHYPKLNPAEKRLALATLVSRPKYAQELLTAVGSKKVSAKDLTADLVRRLRNLEDDGINKQIANVWGTIRKTPAEKAKLIARYKQLVAANPVSEKMLPLGRAVFTNTCMQCHKLFGQGGDIGPELTGSNRADLDYLLTNIIDPSAVLAKEYTASVILTKRGRIITGIIRQETKDAYTVATADEIITLPRDEVKGVRSSHKSMMPEDQLPQMSDADARALLAYLASPKQVPLLATKDNVRTFFNGKDLTGWQGRKKYWRVEKGEIIGIRPAGKPNRNEFLVSDLVVRDFRLSLKVKLRPDSGNSGIQFRSQVLPGGDVSGYQADVGKGWWGKLYEEHGRGLLWTKPGDQHIKKGEWNSYVIEAVGSRIKTYVNGKLCVDLVDPPGRRNGIIALQVHSGSPFEVRFKDLKLEVFPEAKTPTK
ncbi:MAG: PVC-type heme-binding CxxCH protein [Gemmataceae bacterium]